MVDLIGLDNSDDGDNDDGSGDTDEESDDNDDGSDYNYNGSGYIDEDSDDNVDGSDDDDDDGSDYNDGSGYIGEDSDDNDGSDDAVSTGASLRRGGAACVVPQQLQERGFSARVYPGGLVRLEEALQARGAGGGCRLPDVAPARTP